MREEETNWFARWEEELPTPDELMPITQTLITPDLAIAFDIQSNPNNSNSTSPQPHLTTTTPSSTTTTNNNNNISLPPLSQSPLPTVTTAPSPPPSQPLSSDFDSGELGSGMNGDEPARTLKRPRLVWTPQLHKRFVDAVAHLGIKNAVPKTIMQLMSVDGLTRENVASHLQKYRLYLKRMQGLSSGGGGGGNGNGGGAISAADAATDHLFASTAVPHHFLHPGRPNSDQHFMPFVPVAAALQHHHNQQMAAAAVVAAQQQYHQRQVGQFGSPPSGQFENGFLPRQPQPMHRIAVPVPAHPPSYVEDLDPPIGGGGGGGGGGGRKVLTLFPTGDD